MDVKNSLRRIFYDSRTSISGISSGSPLYKLNIRNTIEETLFCLLSVLYGSDLLKPLINKALAYFSLEIRKFADIEFYEKLHPHAVRFIYKNNKILHFISPVYLNDKLVPKELQEAEIRSYGTILKASSVIGGSNAILLEDDYVLYDVALSDKKNNIKYLDGAINHYRGDLFLIGFNKPVIFLDQGILVSGNFSWNYYHLLYEIIVRFKAIDEAEVDPDIPLLIDKICLEVPQYLELLTIFNKSNRKFIPLDFKRKYMVKQLFYFSSPNFVPPHYATAAKIEASNCLFDLSSLGFLRSRLLQAASDGNFPSRIFISRSRASGRRRYNEDEVFGLLEKYGFSKVIVENYRITEQVALFNQADFIAGGSGAAFANLLFCRKSCKVICFTNYKIPISIFSTIATYAGCDLTYIYDESKAFSGKSRLHDQFRIDTGKLNTFISGWLE